MFCLLVRSCVKGWMFGSLAPPPRTECGQQGVEANVQRRFARACLHLALGVSSLHVPPLREILYKRPDRVHHS